MEGGQRALSSPNVLYHYCPLVSELFEVRLQGQVVVYRLYVLWQHLSMCVDAHASAWDVCTSFAHGSPM